MSNYRIKYKKGDFEIEIESTEKNYVDEKIKEMLEASPKQEVKSIKKKAVKKSPGSSSQRSKGDSDSEPQINIPAIVEAINDYDDHEAVDKHILSKSAQLPRIIMCLKFADEALDSPYLTTGNIQTITDQLGVKIKSQNAATTIKSNQKYFTADSVRKVGAIVRYKLNRKGITAFDKLLKGEKLP